MGVGPGSAGHGGGAGGENTYLAQHFLVTKQGGIKHRLGRDKNGENKPFDEHARGLVPQYETELYNVWTRLQSGKLDFSL